MAIKKTTSLFQTILVSSICYLASPTIVTATAPIGYLDRADSGLIAGWAKDDDSTGPVGIHIYIDGQPVKALSADQYRSDVGSHVFGWTPTLSAGSHTVRAYAIGVDVSGNSNGENPELTGSPKTISQSVEYPLTSGDGKVKVVFNSKFGGAITKIYDYANMGELNLVDDAQGGAMFQTAFWLLPYHTSLPPGCADRNDMKLDNPTQAGFIQDGLAGNPIGVFGTSTSPDPDEFIRYENNNQTIHFKSRFIRYDYCQAGGATMDKRQWWDTDFYLEQWATFQADLPNTLEIKSVIKYTGTGPKSITTRQLPVIFARHLPLVAYFQNGQEITNHYVGVSGVETPSFNPDSNWAALIASTTNKVGIGMVASPTMTAMIGKNRFMFGEFPDGGENTNTLFFGSGVADLRTFGITDKVNFDNSSDHVFTFNPGGTFTWTVFYPVGELSQIKQSAEALLSDPSNFGLTAELIPGDLNSDGHINLYDYNILVAGFGTKYTIFDYNNLVANYGK